MKKNAKIFLMNLLFFISLSILFVLIKEQIVNYVTFLRDASPKLTELQVLLSENVTSNIAEAQTTITSIKSQATNFMLFQYLLIPLALFIIWILFQGYIFYLLSESKDIKKYILKFTLTTIPFFLIILILLKFLSLNWIFLAILFFLSYYLINLYLNLNKPLKTALKESINFKLKPFLYYILLIFIILPISLLGFLAILSITGGIFINILISSIFFLIFLYLFSFVEIQFSKVIINR